MATVMHTTELFVLLSALTMLFAPALAVRTNGAPQRDVSASSAMATSCDPDSGLVDQYKISAAGMADIRIYTTTTSSSVIDFYQYGSLQNAYGGSDAITRSNISTIIVHKNAITEEHSLIVINGPPLEPKRPFVRMSVEISSLPANISLAVRDDPNSDTFELSPDAATLSLEWAWKNPYSDGVAVLMRDKNFCVDVSVSKNTHPTFWTFMSGGGFTGVRKNFQRRDSDDRLPKEPFRSRY